MASPTSPRRRHDRPTVIRTCPESGNPAAPSTFWTLRRISSQVTYHFSLGPRRLWTNEQKLAFGRGSPANCLPRGVPRISASPPPWRVIQKSDIIGILYESDNAWRQIFLDGRELGPDFLPAYLGYSTGKWDGDTLVVDPAASTGRHGWIRRANPRRMRCTSPNVFGGRTSGTWKFKLQSTTRRFIPSLGKSRSRRAWRRIATSPKPPARTIAISSTCKGNSVGNLLA